MKILGNSTSTVDASSQVSGPVARTKHQPATPLPISTFVIRRDVQGEIGFHARCQCGWASRGTTKEAVASKWAKQHGSLHARALLRELGEEV